MQTRRQSLIETTTNTVVGLVGSWIITVLAMQYIESRSMAATVSVIGCTIWSILRGYYIRRAFARLEATSK